jgi:hypothetical protein
MQYDVTWPSTIFLGIEVQVDFQTIPESSTKN